MEDNNNKKKNTDSIAYYIGTHGILKCMKTNFAFVHCPYLYKTHHVCSRTRVHVCVRLCFVKVIFLFNLKTSFDSSLDASENSIVIKGVVSVAVSIGPDSIYSIRRYWQLTCKNDIRKLRIRLE